jgi:predicted dehydrogenase
LKKIQIVLLFLACVNTVYSQKKMEKIQLITLDPGHFHAALIQKVMYPDVDPVVQVFAPEGSDLQMHNDRIKSYNTRAENPTAWQQEVYAGKDFFSKMLEKEVGNVVVMSGNNRLKTEYIQKSIEAGYNVLGDKPMAIDKKGFEILKKTFETARKNKVMLYDIMTERYEITTILQRAFSRYPSVFGTLEQGTVDNPAVTKVSVHHFNKMVSGKPLIRPAWFMDVEQQGEGIVDVNTHLVDLIQWECFPEQIIDYQKDIDIKNAKRWATPMTFKEFSKITNLDSFPDYLKKDVVNNILQVYANGEINYTIKGIHAKASVTWAYKAPEGGGDTHYSIMRGTKANLIIKQGAEQNYKPTLYIEPLNAEDNYEPILRGVLSTIRTEYAGIDIEKTEKGWKVIVPKQYDEGHEAHFGRVAERYFQFLKQGKMPAWEVPNMIAKYYTTTTALEMAKKQ